MAFNGSGTFVRLYSWVTDRNNAIKVRADRMDAEMDGFATGLSNAICRDGQTTITANIPFNGNKITGLGTATTGTDALSQDAGDARYQLLDSDLTAIAALSTTGLVARTGSGTAAARTLTGPAAGITVTNGNGVSGNPTLALANDLAAIEAIAGAGFAVRTTTDTWTNRLIENGTGTTAINGTGVSGNASIDVNYATQAQMEAATATNVTVNPAVQKYHPGHPKFWGVQGTGSGGTGEAITYEYNVATTDDNGTGAIDFNFTVGFTNGNFCAIGTAQAAVTVPRLVQLTNRAANFVAFAVNNPSTAAAADPVNWFVCGFGDQS